eukprot:TRINITY_DN6007_c0_g1_i2.p2 TRINITY_DN6007_c0_g1~~TRINITY_DN6007_c0_g1_i2.p2  ORF type:complete len:109 (-),score=27.82 TRINITY_DN6007_c0_g1_i2:101-427(-)
MFPHYELVGLNVCNSPGDNLLCESILRARLPVVPFSIDIKQFTKLELDDDGRIIHHHDFWSVHDLFTRNIPFLKYVDQLRRSWLGAGSSWLVLNLIKSHNHAAPGGSS